MKDFDSWNILKKKIETRQFHSDSFPQEGEVWMNNVGQNIGSEQDGTGESFSRPVLVIKKFNTKIFWIIPLSTKQKNLYFYYNFTDQNQEKVSAILAQLKLSSRKRFERRMYVCDKKVLQEVRLRLKLFF